MTPPQAVVPVASLPTTIANPASHRKTSQPNPSGPCADNTLILGLDVGELDRFRHWIAEAAEFDRRLRLDAELAQTMEYPETMPAYTAMQIDDTGHLWLRVFSPPGLNRERWEVFSPDGTWLGTVAVPLGTAVTQIGSDFLLGIYRDELGTEVVRLHRLVRPGPGS